MIFQNKVKFKGISVNGGATTWYYYVLEIIASQISQKQNL